ncbi:sensor histidine kinase [Fodinicola feengrottensis]|uniref:sensor histidine kinase n=1 Tax=Fodinicola feengrottensis TaxID=435914 RepID=UPI002441B84C|nr:histidine kinase [Fodinicola feengrottensis]
MFRRPFWESRRDALIDIALAAGVAVGGIPILITIVSWHPAQDRFVLDVPWLLLISHVVSSATLLLRRRVPVALCLLELIAIAATPIGLLATTGTILVPADDPSGAWATLEMPFVLYSAIVYTPTGRRRIYAWMLIVALAAIAVRPWQADFGTVSGGLLFTAVPALLGLYIGARRRLIRALTERAERAEREQQLLAEQARAEERTRLAAEMHDVVSHRISLMVLQAGALRVAASDDSTRSAAEDLRSSGVQALDELRELVAVLRENPPADNENSERKDLPASLPDLSALVADSATAGIRVSLDESGNPLMISPAVGRTAYRVVQEALTNVHKHAPGTDVRVQVRYGADQVRLTVRNNAPVRPADQALSSTGSGSGLTGLRTTEWSWCTARFTLARTRRAASRSRSPCRRTCRRRSDDRARVYRGVDGSPGVHSAGVAATAHLAVAVGRPLGNRPRHRPAAGGCAGDGRRPAAVGWPVDVAMAVDRGGPASACEPGFAVAAPISGHRQLDPPAGRVARGHREPVRRDVLGAPAN